MKNIFFFLLISIGAASAQDLKFNKNGKLKIAQFTDLHYIANAEPSKKTIATINYTLDTEKPDLVIFTGDVVVKAPTKQGWDEVLQTVISRKIPYVVTLGNHDDEAEMTREEVAKYVSEKPYLVNKQVKIDGVDGYLNAAIEVKGKTPAVIYAMDSHAYSKNPRIKGYGWFSQNQIAWFTKESAKLKKANQDSTLTALAFFHIPLPEYKLAFDDQKNKRLGVRYEAECPPSINTGMFAAMFEAGDVLGMFVGHDHVNDYLVDYLGIALAYGCWSGSENTYQRNKNGSRIIELTEGKREFYTYIRESDGTLLYPLTYPFPSKKN
jgi:3',5'-cyclic AMP phosphodiesterase CpdA